MEIKKKKYYCGLYQKVTINREGFTASPSIKNLTYKYYGKQYNYTSKGQKRMARIPQDRYRQQRDSSLS